jgi:hypothetical protein
MSIKKLYKSLDGAYFVHFINENNVLCTWNGDEQFKFFDIEGRCIDTLMFEEPVSNVHEAQMIMLEHLEGLPRMEEA